MEKEEKIIELNPLSKGKRMLVFLGDFFITFIFSFILFNLASFPLAKVSFNTEEKANQITLNEEAANDVLIKKGIIFPDTLKTNDFVEYVNYTFKVFLSYYTYDETSVDSSNPQFGHKDENEVIRHYLVDIKGDTKAYLDAFNLENHDQYFIKQ